MVRPALHSNGESHRIAIVGGGIGGLMTARVLQLNKLDVVVFEREPFLGSRSQGGVLDLRSESGQWALSQAGLMQEFRAVARAEGQDMRILDKHAKVLWEEINPPDFMERPEVDRRALRTMLVKSLQPNTIRWDHQLVSIEPQKEQTYHILGFANGVRIKADLVIGADGAGSRVRSVLTDAQTSYCGVNMIEIGINDVDLRYPELARTVGRGSLFALGDNKGVIAQRNGDGRIRIYLAIRMPENGYNRLGMVFDKAPATIRSSLLSQYHGWAPNITNLIKACDDNFIPRPIMALPIGLRWVSHPGVTLLGDAAHLMSPFAGAGANIALQDGAELALKLVELGTCGDLRNAIEMYETNMFKRAKEEAQQSQDNLQMCISKDGAVRMSSFFKQMGHYQLPVEERGQEEFNSLDK